MGIVKKSGSWFSYEDSKLGQGRDSVKEVLRDNPELAEELENKVKEEIANKKA
jgi:recombination protein RecA